jgi:HK97 gp10 family phage protein
MRVQGWYPNEKEITELIENEAMNRLERAGHLVAESARAMVPVRTGKLKSTIRVVRLKGDPKQNIRVYAGSRKKDSSGDLGAYYAHMIENGTIKSPARPFLRPALNKNRGGIMGMMERG